MVGEVTSGQPSPTLGYPVAMAYVDAEYAAPGTALDVDLRGKAEPFEVVALPFYKRAEVAESGPLAEPARPPALTEL